MIDSWDLFLPAIRHEHGVLEGSFLRGQMITRTLAPDNRELAENYAGQLRLTDRGSGLLFRARDPDFGWPRRHQLAGNCSMVAAQHAWQLEMMGQQLGLRCVDINHVSEIGGGYGDMCRQIYLSGFGGSYTIFDFPELQKLQADYLRSCGIKPAFGRLDPLAFLYPGSGSLLIATFSISEMPPQLRQDIEPMITAHDYLMLSWNPTFGEWDNEALFTALNERLQERFTTMIVRDPYMRAGYLFGWRKA